MQRFGILTIFSHTCLLLGVFFSIIGFFDVDFLKKLWKDFYKQILLFGLIGAGFWMVFDYVYELWPYLSGIVLVSEVALLKLISPMVSIMPPLTIVLPNFSITIADYCSGIESIVLFSFLHLMITFYEWKRINKVRIFLIYFPLVVGLFMVNILRVFFIILVGMFYSPDIAAKLFHTYLGMVLFIIYFFVVWRFTYPFILKKHKKQSH